MTTNSLSSSSSKAVEKGVSRGQSLFGGGLGLVLKWKSKRYPVEVTEG